MKAENPAVIKGKRKPLPINGDADIQGDIDDDSDKEKEEKTIKKVTFVPPNIDYMFDYKEKEKFRLLELESNVLEIYVKYDTKDTTKGNDYNLNDPSLKREVFDQRGSAFSQKLQSTMAFNRNTDKFLDDSFEEAKSPEA